MTGPRVVLLHGHDDDPDRFADLAAGLVPPAVSVVVPRGPIATGGGRAAWFESVGGEPDPDQVAHALGAVDEAVAAAGPGPVVLGGFSQGAMLTVDVALHAPGKLAGLALMSGTLLAESVWQPRAAALAGVTIFQSHGTKDGLLAYRGAERLRDFLLAAGAEVGFMPFPGGHELPPPVLEGLAELLARTLAA